MFINIIDLKEPTFGFIYFLRFFFCLFFIAFQLIDFYSYFCLSAVFGPNLFYLFLSSFVDWKLGLLI